MNDAAISERLDRLTFYRTPEHECNYLPDRQASTVFVDPQAELNDTLYTQLSGFGFRRSGRYLYRPECQGCQACIPMRLPVHDFHPSRAQRRCLKANQDLDANICDTRFRQEHYDLYEKYLASRHPDGGMADTTPEKYLQFLSCDWSNTRFVEFRLGRQLAGIAVTDILDHALSAVYTFFDPDLQRRSPGVYAVLWQIEHARTQQMSWLYLGYWIQQTRKMAYKAQYRPHEILRDNEWLRVE